MNFRISGILLALSLVFCSCQKDPSAGSVTGTPVILNMGGVQTKAVSMGENVDRVYYEVWDESFSNRLFPTDSRSENFVPVEDNVAYVNLQLLKGQVFNVIFWAQNSGCGVYSWDNLKDINVDYSGFSSSNKDVYDAFYAVEQLVADGQYREIYLYRPFAQLNFGTGTLETSLGEFSIGSNRITVSKVAKTFNTVRGAANPDSYIEGVTFVASEGGLVQQEKADRKDLEIGDDCYYWVAMNYLLVPSSQEATVTVDAEFVTSGGKVSHSIDNVPIRKNYRTNIIGELFTAQGKFKVKVNPIFDGEYNHSDSAE